MIIAENLSSLLRIIDNKKVLNVLSKNVINLNLIENLEESVDDCFNQGRIFILHCYNQDTTKTLNSARKKTWKSTLLRNKSDAPKLESLPPTDEAFFSKSEKSAFANCRMEKFDYFWSANC